MRYWVRVYRQGKDFSAMVPDLPGCVAAGDSVEEVLQLIAEAISIHLESLRQSGERISSPTQHVDLDLDDLEAGEICTWVDVKPSGGKPRRKQRVGGK